jgi:hypothetical protein
LSACADAHRVHGEPRGQRLDEPTPAYQCLLSNHRAMREELLALLAQLIELRPNTRMSDVLEDMLAVLGTLENGRPLD